MLPSRDNAGGKTRTKSRFNLLIDAIPQVEVRWGIPAKPTCKGTTRRVFIFVSAELHARLARVQVLEDWFPDHALRTASFRGCDQVVLWTFESTVHRSPLAPPTKDRQGEVSHAFFGLNAQMARLTRQLRRVQAYKQAMPRTSPASQAVEARASPWQTVHRAPGFRPSFPVWWIHRPVHL